ncbi:hypothetical protein [Geodermatophilus ruber]|uniref:Glycosyl hydrolase family 76 n=1 Tax=Geodermatophilus ruber TaxID=504800 RepID=A0A1I4DJL7_9ACTN|nr:hypothetical protein [Geodermatophilus ruber]SFK92940.1 hypothetical protein SAMN04488085_104400 [Geodermatophilus ruber]
MTARRERGLRSLPWRALVLLAVVALVASCESTVPTGSGPPPPRAQPTEELLPVDHWRALFDAEARAVTADGERLSRSSDSFDFYTLAYSIDEQASMFEATGDFGYARQGLRYVTNMIASARPSSSLPTSSFQDGFAGWVSADNDDDETPLYESYAWRYVTRLLRLLQPVLAEAPADLREPYEEVLAFTETHILDKWFARGADAHIYRSRTHMAAHWALIALDLAHLTDDPDRRARCLDIVRTIDDDLHEQFRPHPEDPTAYWWSDVWSDATRPGQDVSHGNGVVAYIVEARDLDAGWSEEDVARLSRTLTEFLLATPGRYPRYVDGSGESNGWLADGWVKLGRYDPAVQTQLQSYPVQNSQYYAAMAVNAALLAGRTG